MHQTEKIRVLIVDDHDLLRKGVAVALLTCADIIVVGEASNGVEALECCKTLAIDVILMDVVMPKMDGIMAARIIREAYPNIQIVALTAFDEEAFIESALESGCVSYLIKNISVAQLATTIRAAYGSREHQSNNQLRRV